MRGTRGFPLWRASTPRGHFCWVSDFSQENVKTSTIQNNLTFVKYLYPQNYCFLSVTERPNYFHVVSVACTAGVFSASQRRMLFRVRKTHWLVETKIVGRRRRTGKEKLLVVSRINRIYRKTDKVFRLLSYIKNRLWPFQSVSLSWFHLHGRPLPAPLYHSSQLSTRPYRPHIHKRYTMKNKVCRLTDCVKIRTIAKNPKNIKNTLLLIYSYLFEAHRLQSKSFQKSSNGLSPGIP